jgi:hypothetical protein
MIRPDVQPDNPIGGWHRQRRSAMLRRMLLELGVIALTIVCFVLLDLYVVGSERL